MVGYLTCEELPLNGLLVVIRGVMLSQDMEEYWCSKLARKSKYKGIGKQ